MSEYVKSEEQKKWLCAKDNVPMEIAAVRIAYLHSAFPVNLLKCPICGRVFIPEELALGRMAEVEKSLEDK